MFYIPTTSLYSAEMTHSMGWAKVFNEVLIEHMVLILHSLNKLERRFPRCTVLNVRGSWYQSGLQTSLSSSMRGAV